MNIGIDASRYKHVEPTGVEFYSHFIINGILERTVNDKKKSAILYSSSPIQLSTCFNNPHIINKVLKAKSFWTLFKLSMEMRKSPPDLLFVPSHTFPLFLPKKSVITIHDVAFKHLRDSYSLKEYLYLDWSTKFAVKHANKIIVPSQSTKNDLIRFYNCPENKIKVILHGFTKPKFNSNQKENDFEESEIFEYFKINKKTKYIFYIGRLESKKNIKRLIEAFIEFSKNFPDYKLILGGKRGTGFDEIKNENMFTNKIIMPGFLTEKEKAILYRNCQFFVFPSLYEGFGLPLLESFYYKKAVISSNTGSLREVGADAVKYVDPYKIEEIQSAMELLANNKNYRKELELKGNKRLKKFNWKKTCDETYKILIQD